MKDDPLKEKSYQFAIRIVKLSQFLQQDKKEFVLSKQVLRSGTAVGALIREAEFGQSRADFSSKMAMSLKQLVVDEVVDLHVSQPATREHIVASAIGGG